MNISTGIAPLLVHGITKSTKAEADVLNVALRRMDSERPTCVFVNKPSDFQFFSASSMLLMMAWDGGAEALQTMQAYRDEVPHKSIIVVGSCNDPQFRKNAFINGADNFVCRDATATELQAVIKRLWYHTHPGMHNPTISLGGLDIWLEEKVVLRNGKPVPLSSRELEMLLLLAKKHPEPVSRRMMERKVFGLRENPGTNVVAVHVHRLRKKISVHGSKLETVNGGYQLN